MNTLNKIKNLDYKIIIVIFAIMGLTGGYSVLSDGVEFTGKILFSFYGLLIGLLLGLGFTILLNRWKATPSLKTTTVLTFFLLGIAPMFWAYFDFEEHIESKKGLLMMLGIDLLVLTLLIILKWNEKRKLISAILTIPIWQVIGLFWFICLTWKKMNYWD